MPEAGLLATWARIGLARRTRPLSPEHTCDITTGSDTKYRVSRLWLLGGPQIKQNSISQIKTLSLRSKLYLSTQNSISRETLSQNSISRETLSQNSISRKTLSQNSISPRKTLSLARNFISRANPRHFFLSWVRLVNNNYQQWLTSWTQRW